MDFSSADLNAKQENGNRLIYRQAEKIAEKQTNELLRVQTVEYVEFISRLIENASIMNKNFYLIVPLGTSVNPNPAGFLSKIFGGGKAKEAAERIENFEKAKEQLDTRIMSASSGLSSVGLKAVRLKNRGNNPALLQFI